MLENIADKSDVNQYLSELKNMIRNNARLILSNREKNMMFCENNDIKVDKIKKILLNLRIDDFCKVLNNKGINLFEKLYLFAPYIKNKDGKYQQLYVKINKIVEKKLIILVSFHESKYFLKTKYKNRSDSFE